MGRLTTTWAYTSISIQWYDVASSSFRHICTALTSLSNPFFNTKFNHWHHAKSLACRISFKLVVRAAITWTFANISLPGINFAKRSFKNFSPRTAWIAPLLQPNRSDWRWTSNLTTRIISESLIRVTFTRACTNETTPSSNCTNSSYSHTVNTPDRTTANLDTLCVTNILFCWH
jgi:hypothetical protein